MENLKILNQLKEINKSIVRLTDYIIEINNKTVSHLQLIYDTLKTIKDKT